MNKSESVWMNRSLFRLKVTCLHQKQKTAVAKQMPHLPDEIKTGERVHTVERAQIRRAKSIGSGEKDGKEDAFHEDDRAIGSEPVPAQKVFRHLHHQ